MTGFVEQGGNSADALTGERIFPNERVFDTGIKNRRMPYMGASKTRLVKEDTIVWLAEQAGYTLTKRDAGDSRDTKVVDESDVSVGGGEDQVGEAKGGGSKPVKRRSNGSVKSK